MINNEIVNFAGDDSYMSKVGGQSEDVQAQVASKNSGSPSIQDRISFMTKAGEKSPAELQSSHRYSVSSSAKNSTRSSLIKSQPSLKIDKKLMNTVKKFTIINKFQQLHSLLAKPTRVLSVCQYCYEGGRKKTERVKQGLYDAWSGPKCYKSILRYLDSKSIVGSDKYNNLAPQNKSEIDILVRNRQIIAEFTDCMINNKMGEAKNKFSTYLEDLNGPNPQLCVQLTDGSRSF